MNHLILSATLSATLVLFVCNPIAADHMSALTEEALAGEVAGKAALQAYEKKYGREDTFDELVFEDNLSITARDGTQLSADVFRPKGEGKFPVILSVTPYQKDMPWQVPPDHEAQPGAYQNWEVPNPERWVPKGYVLVRVDVRGTGLSQGRMSFAAQQDWEDFYDAVEWSGKQPWSNGNVGLAGVSYMALNQWHVADLQPPSLKAMIPWEGLADMYRDSSYVGGIYSAAFQYVYLPEFYRDAVLRGWVTATDEDTFHNTGAWHTIYNNLLDGDYWDDKVPDWSKVTVPLLSAGNWNGWKGAGHLRGNLEGFKQAAAKHKRLRVHTGAHQDAYYSEEGFLEQLRFYDHWLLGIQNGVDRDAPVKLAVRHGVGRFDFTWREEQEWPLARTQYKKMYLSAGDGPVGKLLSKRPRKTTTLGYKSPGLLLAGNVKEPGTSVQFVSPPFESDTEVTGEILLNLWLSSTIEDGFPHATLFRLMDGKREVVTTGRLRASQRELDKAKTTASRPYHTHRQRDLLKPGKPVELQIEIAPTSMIFPAGSQLMINLSGDSPATLMATAISSRKAKNGTETIHTGGKYDSYLQLPVIPAAP